MRILGYIVLVVGFLMIMMEATIGQSERCAIWLGRTTKVLSENNITIESPVATTMFEIISGTFLAIIMMAATYMAIDTPCRF